MKYKVPVQVLSTFSGRPGTWVLERKPGLESRRVTGLACERRQARVQLVAAENRPELLGRVLGLLAELGFSGDLVSHAVLPHEPERAHVAFCMPGGELALARPRLEQLGAEVKARQVLFEGGLSKVSLVGIGIRSDPQVCAVAVGALGRAGIVPVAVTASELRVSCLVQEAQADTAVNLLHEAFELGTVGAASP
jgi:aspartate kinase